MRKQSRWEDKRSPKLIVNAKYVPYAALRQQLWRCLLNQYDADDSGRLSRLEFVTMLDSLESTLSQHTINGFFQRFRHTTSDQEGEAEELTIDQAVICLEDQLLQQMKRSINKTHPAGSEADVQSFAETSEESGPANSHQLTFPIPESESSGDIAGLEDLDEKTGERVIRITECPLCHQSRLNKRSEVDMITHLATCVSQDWRRVDRFVMSGFVTPDQAHRKWYTKVSCQGPSVLIDR